jgi:hypothetical protein
MTRLAHRVQKPRRRSWAPANDLSEVRTSRPLSSRRTFSVVPTTTPALRPMVLMTTPTCSGVMVLAVFVPTMGNTRPIRSTSGVSARIHSAKSGVVGTTSERRDFCPLPSITKTGCLPVVSRTKAPSCQSRANASDNRQELVCHHANPGKGLLPFQKLLTKWRETAAETCRGRQPRRVTYTYELSKNTNRAFVSPAPVVDHPAPQPHWHRPHLVQ